MTPRLLADEAADVLDPFDEVTVGSFARTIERDGDYLADTTGVRGHHDHAIGERDRFLDVVGDEQYRFLGLGLHVEEFAVEHLAGPGVDAAEGFVHEQEFGVDGERTGDGDPLFHTAREL